MNTKTSRRILIKSTGGFGNKVFDLIAAIYLQNKYGVEIFFAVSKYDGPFMGKIFPNSGKKIFYIGMDNYVLMSTSILINEITVNTLDDLPETIISNTIFIGLHKFAYTMYDSLPDLDKKIFEINPDMLSSSIKSVNSVNYACVHIRYGDRLCYALEDFNQTKYSPYLLPVYSPQYYIDQINELLETNVDKIFIITDSSDLVQHVVIDKLSKSDRIEIRYPSYETIDHFYLLTKAKYIVMSYSTFSFAAAYFNPHAVSYLLKQFVLNNKKYVYEEDVISPKWIIIDNKEYLLNHNQNLLKELIKEYSNYCNLNDNLVGGRNKNSSYYSNTKKIHDQHIDNLVTNGPITITKTNIDAKLVVYGTLNFTDLIVNGTIKNYGTIYGKNGNLKNLNIYGTLNIQDTKFDKLILHGTLNADNIIIKSDAFMVGRLYARNTKINKIVILSNITRFDDSIINNLIINNTDNKPKKIFLKNTNVNKLVVKGKSLTINISADSKIKQSVNATVYIDKDL